jgi:hypothetical protein
VNPQYKSPHHNSLCRSRPCHSNQERSNAIQLKASPTASVLWLITYSWPHGPLNTEQYLCLNIMGESDSCNFLMCYEDAIASSGGDDTTLVIHYITRECSSQLVCKTATKIHHILGTVERKVSCQFPRLPNKTQYRGRFLVVSTV